MNPNGALSASYDQSINMKKLILLCICSIALAAGLFAQAPTASPIASPPAATVTPTTTASVSPSDLADRIHQKLEKKLRGHHGITIDTGDKDEDADVRKMRDFIAIPIVAIVFLSIFGAPVLIVIMIGMFTLISEPHAAAHHPDDGGERSANSSGTACACRAIGAPAIRRAARSYLDHGWAWCHDLLWRRERLGRRRMVIGTDSVSDWPRLSPGMEIGRQKQRSSSSAGTVISRLWS